MLVRQVFEHNMHVRYDSTQEHKTNKNAKLRDLGDLRIKAETFKFILKIIKINGFGIKRYAPVLDRKKYFSVYECVLKKIGSAEVINFPNCRKRFRQRGN